MISAGELAEMRTELDASLPDSCAIQRPTDASDGALGQTRTYGTVATLACRLAPRNFDRQDEQAIADRETAIRAQLITFSAGADVRERDRIVAGGRTFEVQSIDGPRSWELSRRVQALEVL